MLSPFSLPHDHRLIDIRITVEGSLSAEDNFITCVHGCVTVGGFKDLLLGSRLDSDGYWRIQPSNILIVFYSENGIHVSNPYERYQLRVYNTQLVPKILSDMDTLGNFLSGAVTARVTYVDDPEIVPRL